MLIWREYLQFILPVVYMNGEYTVGLCFDLILPLEEILNEKTLQSKPSHKPVEEERRAQL